MRKRVLFATEGKDQETWIKFLAALENHNGHRHSITQASMDMSQAYQRGVSENCRNAQVVFDKFHVIKMPTRRWTSCGVPSAVGRQGGWESLYKSQWLWRKNPENLTAEERARLDKIEDKNLGTAKAYQMRLVLQDIYRSPTAPTARRRFQVWCRWVRWVARFYHASLLTSMVKLAQMIENHLAGILAHWKWGVTNAFMEGLNSVFRPPSAKHAATAQPRTLSPCFTSPLASSACPNLNSTENSEEPFTSSLPLHLHAVLFSWPPYWRSNSATSPWPLVTA